MQRTNPIKLPSMRFDDPQEREAFREVARKLCDMGCTHWRAPVVREMDQWIMDLDAWDGGPPPPPFAS